MGHKHYSIETHQATVMSVLLQTKINCEIWSISTWCPMFLFNRIRNRRSIMCHAIFTTHPLNRFVPGSPCWNFEYVNLQKYEISSGAFHVKLLAGECRKISFMVKSVNMRWGSGLAPPGTRSYMYLSQSRKSLMPFGAINLKDFICAIWTNSNKPINNLNYRQKTYCKQFNNQWLNVAYIINTLP